MAPRWARDLRSAPTSPGGRVTDWSCAGARASAATAPAAKQTTRRPSPSRSRERRADLLPEDLADAALRRAAQLQAEAAERIERQASARASDNRLTLGELANVAREAGIAEEYLTLALAEVEQQGRQSLALVDDRSELAITRWLGTRRRSLSVSRRFAAPAAELLAVLPDAFEGDDYRLSYVGQSGGHPLTGGVMQFHMPRLAEMARNRGTFTQLCYRLEQLEIWSLQVTLHDHGATTQVVIYLDLRRGALANVRVARGCGQDLVITGKSGTGKSHILQALALCACEAGLIVRYTRFADLLGELHAGLADGSYDRRLRRWARADLVVLDDVGLGQVPTAGDMPSAAHMLWSLVDLRHERRATAITSNIKLSAWGRYLGDATVTAAVLDRLAMTSLRIDIDGPSWRQRAANERAGVDPRGDSDGDDEEAPEVPGHE